jgi:predicted RNA-binding protein Jag
LTEDQHRQIEATGETVGEAKWSALRELEKLHPDLDKSAVEFQVVSEGERGLLGVGYAPARVIASIGQDSGRLRAKASSPGRCAIWSSGSATESACAAGSRSTRETRC